MEELDPPPDPPGQRWLKMNPCHRLTTLSEDCTPSNGIRDAERIPHGTIHHHLIYQRNKAHRISNATAHKIRNNMITKWKQPTVVPPRMHGIIVCDQPLTTAAQGNTIPEEYITEIRRDRQNDNINGQNEGVYMTMMAQIIQHNS
jgi:hypothetical protein